MRYIIGMISLLWMAGCSPEPLLRGNFVDLTLLKGKEGIASREQVEALVGSPAFVDPSNSSRFIYTGSKGTRYTFFVKTIHETQTIAVEYDAAGLLKKVTPINDSSL